MATHCASMVGRLVATASAVALASTARADPPDPSAAGATGDPPQSDTGADAQPPQDEPTGATGDAYSDTDPSALTDFRATLDPHGTWTQDAAYGTVWAPNPDEVGADFAPYVSGGHWAYDSDYVWVSDYEWGWATFHYGRWQWMASLGWVWIPGRLYAAAWVTWRVGGDEFAFVGWAPASPAWVWLDGIAVVAPPLSAQRFAFCPPGDLFAPALGTHVVTGDQAAALAAHTRPYVPARPTVSGGPVASPRVLSTPVGRPVTAFPHGPPPASLGIDLSRVVRVRVGDRGSARALAYARPSTAVAIGARAPSPHVPRIAPAPAPAPVRPLAGPMGRHPARRK